MNVYVNKIYDKMVKLRAEKDYQESAGWKTIYFVIRMRLYMKKCYPGSTNFEERNLVRIQTGLRFRANVANWTDIGNAAKMVYDNLYEIEWRDRFRDLITKLNVTLVYAQKKVRYQLA